MMTPSSGTKPSGFTLLEVMIAVLVFGLVMGGLSQLVVSNLRRHGEARNRAEAMRLGESEVRRIASEARSGTLPEIGVTEGTFDSPNEDVQWILSVESFAIPLAPERLETQNTSSLFAPGGSSPDAPQPSARRVVLRVFRDEEDPEVTDPFVIFAVEQVNPSQLPAAPSLPPDDSEEDPIQGPVQEFDEESGS